MNEEELLGAWTTFERTVSQRRRINEQVFTWLEAHDTSLAAEWIGLFKTAPAAALGPCHGKRRRHHRRDAAVPDRARARGCTDVSV